MAQMAQQQDYVALEWVKGEIGQTLKQAQQSLETFAEKPEGSPALRFCLAHVHQIKGSLQMVEAHALVQLAADMEALILALEAGHRQALDEALQVLMQAMLQLPLWLEQLSTRHSDLTLSILPLRNQLRAARGEAPLAQPDRFGLKLPEPRPPLPASELLERDVSALNERLQRMRLALQKALPGIVRGQDVPTNLDYLSRVFSALERLCQQAPLYPLWQVAAALVEGLKSGAISASPALHILLRKLDHELKLLIQNGIAGINQNPPEDLLSGLLLQVAGAQKSSPRLNAVKAEYGLEALQQTEAPGISDAGLEHSSPDALRAVVSALCEDLLWVKDELDLFVRSHNDNVAVLSNLLQPLKQVEGTLSILGFSQAQKAIQRQIDILHALTSGQQSLAYGVLLDMAGALLYVESSLIGMVTHEKAQGSQPLPDAVNLPHSQQLVLQESLSRLGEAKDAFIEFISSEWQRETLKAVPELLVEVSGALQLASFERAAKILVACKGYVEQSLLAYGQMPPDWQSLDRLADAISAVEYYLERLRIDPPDQGEAVLLIAEQSLQALGCTLDAPEQAPISEASESLADAVEQEQEQDETPPAPIAQITAQPAVLAGDGLPAAAEQTQQDSALPALSIGEVLVAPVTPINPPAAEAPPSLLPPPEDEEPLDDELLEVFVEELNEVQDELHKLLPRWQSAAHDRTLQSDIRRAFHTLKGSGRMVRALIIGELAWSVENLLNRVLDGSREASEAVLALVNEVTALLPELRDEFAARTQRQRDDVDRLAARAHALAKGQAAPAETTEIEEIEEAEAAAAAETAHETAHEPPATPTEAADEADAWLNQALQVMQEPPALDLTEAIADEISIDALDTADTVDSEDLTALNQSADAEIEGSAVAAPDSSLLDIFHQEAQDHLDTLAEFLKGCVEQLPQPVTDALHAAMHTLKGSAHMAGVLPIAQIAAPLEKLLETLKSCTAPVDLAEARLLGRAGSLFRQALSQLDAGSLCEVPGTDALLHDIDALREQHQNARQPLASDQSQPPLGEFLTDGMDTLLKAGQQLAQWRASGQLPQDFAPLLEALAQLTTRASQIGLLPFEALCSTLLALYRAFAAGELPTSSAFFDEAQKTHDLLLSMLDNVALMMEVAAEPAQIATLQALLRQGSADQAASEQEDTASATAQTPTVSAASESEEEVEVEVEAQPAAESVNATPHQASAPAEYEGDELDEELLAIFLEEANEILGEAANQLQRWMEQPQNLQALQVLQRYLHTLKGSARATGFLGMGHLAHALEFLYEDLAADTLEASPALLELLQQGHDRLALMLEALEQGKAAEDAEDLIAAIARFRDGGQVTTDDSAAPAQAEAHAESAALAESEAENTSETQQTPAAAEPQPAQAPAVSQAPAVTPAAERSNSEPLPVGAGKVLPFARRAQQARSAAPDSQEQVRISANKLDSFSNLAGEISIFRARIEQQVGDFGFTLAEMESTIERVRRQLRQLDIETQAQTISRYQATAEQEGEDFDPLEMDRHSQLQQLARALFEAATDLLDLKQDLTTQSRDAQTLLLQQARVGSQLQENLMQTRLVRFERVVPRLSRIVRQLSRELNKKVELQVDNAHSEMDRILLEHLNAPLEHMLRNAIDHGIESADERLAAGKPAAGQIRLSLARDGGDIVLTLQDDGRGINLEAVRRKAIERGLAQEGDELSAQDIRQFVLEAGFSTAAQVSQTSGRGIGMDVVQSEIRRAGGSLAIDSTQGAGTCFTIRLPFTVSVSRALMVRSGDDLYALALATVEGVARLSADELSRQYAQPTPTLNYGGQSFALHYLGDLLGNGQKPKLVGHSLPLPVILVKSGEQHLAVQVDSLSGAREIVVKGLGHPFGNIPGISGATILGDGNVVVILDLPALMRKYQRQLLSVDKVEAKAEDSSRPLLIMVVDDSITVRKVTGRLLERHGMNVLTAKDGMEAIDLLQEHKPDLMLLDIEMPRMDGFEVATLVRHNEQLKELPIIMITSRTGIKHRERGLSIGVNDYLGKPYQDAQLLGRIEQLTRHIQHA